AAGGGFSRRIQRRLPGRCRAGSALAAAAPVQVRRVRHAQRPAPAVRTDHATPDAAAVPGDEEPRRPADLLRPPPTTQARTRAGAMALTRIFGGPRSTAR